MQDDTLINYFITYSVFIYLSAWRESGSSLQIVSARHLHVRCSHHKLGLGILDLQSKRSLDGER